MRTRQQTCPCCGKKFWSFTSFADASRYNRNWKGGVCGDCAMWLDFAKSPNQNIEIINGICYEFLPPQKNVGAGDMLGGWRMRYIFKKDGSVKKSNDIWKIGEVPCHLRELLPDTGWWCSRTVFQRMKQIPFVCRNLGCYDRYHCMRYDFRQEYETGPYNAIPRDYRTGDEKCKSFVNILEIEHYYGDEIMNE